MATETVPRKDVSDPSADLTGKTGRHPLDPFFHPRNVAVIGASERAGSVGRTVLWNLVSHPFGGTVFPVNAKRQNVLGIKAYPSVGAVPDAVDLAVIVTPASTVPAVMRECAAAGVKAAIVISAGFKEIGRDGAALEREVMQIARAAHIRVVGPNCLGVMNPVTGFNATLAGASARPGNVAFLSQSGALLTSVLDWSIQENVGFSAFASLGSMIDVGWGDLIDYLGDDGSTRSILLYMESIGGDFEGPLGSSARAFLSAAREVSLRKPIIVIKAGRTSQAAQAAASHTGTLAGSDEVFTAAFRRTGVLRVDTIADLFYMADALAKQPRPAGRRLTIITNAGGPGVLATDALIAAGGELATPTPASQEALAQFLPPQWSRGNPVDILGDAGPERYERAVQVAVDDPGSDGLLVVLTPQDLTEPTQTANRLKVFAHKNGRKPLLASWMGGAEVAPGRRILSDAGIPTFDYPDTAAQIFDYMWKYTYNLRALYETPTLADDSATAAGRLECKALLRRVRGEGRTLLTELESKQVLAAWGIEAVETRLAATADEAAHHAAQIGYPVVVKLHSRTITHKTEVDGVRLNLMDEASVRAAFAGIAQRLDELGKRGAFEGVTVQPMVRLGGVELIVGSTVDPQFGPVLLFGAGGTLVEVIRDRSLGLPPLNTTLARRMMERTRVWDILRGVRGRAPVDIAALEMLLVRFSQLVAEERLIAEIDVNPLLASPTQLIALDARVVLHDPSIPEDQLPRPAIRPYPSQYIGKAKVRSGEEFLVRPIRPEDETKMIAFHKTLSDDSIYMRYAGFLKLDQRVAHDRLARICFLDYDREMALVCERAAVDGAPATLLAVARLTRLPGRPECEFALLITDSLQGQGLGNQLLSRLIGIGRDWGMERIVADVLPQNEPMQRLCRRLGFTLFHEEEGMVRAVRQL